MKNLKDDVRKNIEELELVRKQIIEKRKREPEGQRSVLPEALLQYSATSAVHFHCSHRFRYFLRFHRAYFRGFRYYSPHRCHIC